MSTSAALLASAVAGAGTLLMRLAGVTPLSRRLGEVPWIRHVPLAVLLVLAVSAVAGGEVAVPSPAVVAGTAVVAGAAAWRAPLLVSVVVGCGVYVAVGVGWPGW
ncbi:MULTISPECIES: AzlD domain-containing protein [Streptomyces]|uniref:AzlD domain-containing protein n=1 Tax=Streptomyces TaxID=1883 RepID=UPI00163D170F|nr:AzlD domain-containing protein [Streptomyces sp. TYQ1024]